MMSVLYLKKKGKEEFWKLGKNLANLLLCFYFVVLFIQELGSAPDSFPWVNGFLVVVTAVASYYEIAIKPKK